MDTYIILYGLNHYRRTHLTKSSICSTVTDINCYQNPDTTGNLAGNGYNRLAFNRLPPGAAGDSFFFYMPVSEVLQGNPNWPTTRIYSMQLELVPANAYAMIEALDSRGVFWDWRDVDNGAARLVLGRW